jgi:hypothetical protein
MGRLWVWTGVITGKELIANNEHILATKRYESVRWLIVDETATTAMEVSPEEVRTLKRLDDRLAAVLPELVTAVVVPTNFAFGMARMWEIMTERPGWSVGVFRDMGEAKQWVRGEVRRKFSLELPEELSAP